MSTRYIQKIRTPKGAIKPRKGLVLEAVLHAAKRGAIWLKTKAARIWVPGFLSFLFREDRSGSGWVFFVVNAHYVKQTNGNTFNLTRQQLL